MQIMCSVLRFYTELHPALNKKKETEQIKVGFALEFSYFLLSYNNVNDERGIRVFNLLMKSKPANFNPLKILLYRDPLH